MTREIKRPVRTDGLATSPRIAKVRVVDATGAEVCSVWAGKQVDAKAVAREVVAKLNAAPEAGDVEALAAFVHDKVAHFFTQTEPGAPECYGAAEEIERMIAAREAQLRGALKRIQDYGGEDWPPTGEIWAVRRIAKDALATPAYPAAERYAALERLPKLMHRALPWVQAAKLIKFRIPYPPTEQPHPDAEALAVEIVAALHELDGKDGVDE